jgi:hypothetical protein
MKKLKLNLQPLEGKSVSLEADRLYIYDETGIICIVPAAARQMALLKGGHLVAVTDGKSDAPISYGEAFMRFDAAVCGISVFG